MKNLNTKNIFTEYNDVVKVKDLQKMLGIGRSFAYKLLQEKYIFHFKIGNKIFIPKQSIVDFICKNGAIYEG